jgi:hypothetical protein
MANIKQSRGKCEFCSKEMTKGGLARHFKTCVERQTATLHANSKSGNIIPLYHLQVQDAYNSNFWLHLEMRGSSSLKTLDLYLRAIWLECCGHLSHFSIGSPWGGHELGINSKARSVFNPGVQYFHIYDYGTSSETIVTVVGVREGKPLSINPIFLMARNNIPQVECQYCGKFADWLCMECLYEDDEPGWLCDEHGDGHPHAHYDGLYPVVNSPRLGLCGYDGPAEPPY